MHKITQTHKMCAESSMYQCARFLVLRLSNLYLPLTFVHAHTHTQVKDPDFALRSVAMQLYYAQRSSNHI